MRGRRQFHDLQNSPRYGVYIDWSVYKGCMDERALSTRDRIRLAGGTLFYAEWIHLVSMDTIAEAGGVTKRTLYYLVRSKGDLIAAWLETRDQPNLTAFQHCWGRADEDADRKVQLTFERLAVSARRQTWKGCGFLRTSVELVNLPEHPAIVAGRAYKKRVEAWLASMLHELGPAETAQTLARQIILLMDGASAVVLLHRDPTFFEAAGEAAASLARACQGNGSPADQRDGRGGSCQESCLILCVGQGPVVQPGTCLLTAS